jgi:hypothetical protein
MVILALTIIMMRTITIINTTQSKFYCILHVSNGPAYCGERLAKSHEDFDQLSVAH